MGVENAQGHYEEKLIQVKPAPEFKDVMGSLWKVMWTTNDSEDWNMSRILQLLFNVVVFVPKMILLIALPLLTPLALIPFAVGKGSEMSVDFFHEKVYGTPCDTEELNKTMTIATGIAEIGAIGYGLYKWGASNAEPVETVAEPEPVELQDQWRNAATNTYEELSGSTGGKAAMAGAALVGVGAAAAAGYGAYKAIQGVRNRGKTSDGDSTDSKSGNKSSKKRGSGKKNDKKESSSSSWMIYAVIGGVVLILLFLIFTSGDKSDRVQVMQPDIENGLLRQD